VLRFDAVQAVALDNDFGETLAQGHAATMAAQDAPAWWSHLVPTEQVYRLTLESGPAHQRVGELRVVVSQLPRIERFLQGLGHATAVSVARALAVALVLGLLSYATLTRPLTAIARRMGPGTPDAAPRAMAEAARRDEIGQIASAFLRYEDEVRNKTASLQASAAQLAASETRYRRIVDTAGEGVWQLDDQGRTTFANDAIAQMLGTTSALLMGRAMAEFVDPADAALLPQALRQRSGGDRPRLQLRFVRSDASCLRAELSVCPISGADGGHAGALVMLTDATERLHQEDALRASNERLRAMVEELERHKHDMAQITELNELLQSARNETEAIAVISAAARRLFGDRSGGLSMADDQGGDMLRVGAWGSVAWVPERYAREDCWAIRRGTPHEQSTRRGLRCGHHHPGLAGTGTTPGTTSGPDAGADLDTHAGSTLCTPLYIEGELLGVLHVADGADSASPAFDDALRQRVQVFGEVVKLGLSNLRLREHLRDQAVRDPLTGLPNRRMFDEILPRELARSGRAGQVLTIAVIDVDHFKHFNDRYGHKVGDRVLQAVATTLTRSVRAGDLCCRYGGDEFLCLLVGMSAAEAKARFEQVLADLATGAGNSAGVGVAAAAGDMPEPVSFTVGLASASGPGGDAALLMQAADAALYTAKARGRNCVEVAAPLVAA
jgi:diguanylate cyclase (GGDEF)-like protein/PAS domain S-box-containing protein